MNTACQIAVRGFINMFYCSNWDYKTQLMKLQRYFQLNLWRGQYSIVATTAMDTYGGGHLWGRTPMGVLPQGVLGGVHLGRLGWLGRLGPRVRVSMLFVRCALFLCVFVCANKDNSGVVRCMGHGSCVKLKPGAPVSFPAYRSPQYI